MLFNEPKLLKFRRLSSTTSLRPGFSALQRAEIAEMVMRDWRVTVVPCFSALQRAEIAEIILQKYGVYGIHEVSVLFNEPKLLKLICKSILATEKLCFSALQRAEIAEMPVTAYHRHSLLSFQCSSTSRNC